MTAQTSSPDLARVRKVLRSVPLIDGHNDLPWRIRAEVTPPRDVAAYDLRQHTSGHTDLARLAAGQVGAQFWSVYVPGEVKDSGYARIQLEQIDIARRIISQYPDRLALALTAADIEREFRQHRIASLIGMEGGHAIENSLGALRVYYGLGARYMTLTHNVTTDWADAALDSARHGGVTPFGREVVREMNRLGMLVDLSHVSPGTMSAALDVTEAPVMFSHSAARALVDHPRNVPDSILRRLPANGGIVMVTFVPGFLTEECRVWIDALLIESKSMAEHHGEASPEYRAAEAAWLRDNPRPPCTVADVADHVEHVRAVAGVDHVGLGGDYDGVVALPDGLEGVDGYPRLIEELATRGWSDADLARLTWHNAVRVLRDTEAAARSAA